MRRSRSSPCIRNRGLSFLFHDLNAASHLASLRHDASRFSPLHAAAPHSRYRGVCTRSRPQGVGIHRAARSRVQGPRHHPCLARRPSEHLDCLGHGPQTGRPPALRVSKLRHRQAPAGHRRRFLISTSITVQLSVHPLTRMASCRSLLQTDLGVAPSLASSAAANATASAAGKTPV